MIRLNVSIIVDEIDKREKLIDAAKELVAFSLHDKGCISYEFYGSLTNANCFMIIETWESRDALEKHKDTMHFKTIVPKLHELSSMTTLEFEF